MNNTARYERYFKEWLAKTNATIHVPIEYSYGNLAVAHIIFNKGKTGELHYIVWALDNNTAFHTLVDNDPKHIHEILTGSWNMMLAAAEEGKRLDKPLLKRLFKLN